MSRLLDVCRQSLIFDSVEDLHRCLRLIAADPDVALAQIKNRMAILDFDLPPPPPACAPSDGTHGVAPIQGLGAGHSASARELRIEVQGIQKRTDAPSEVLDSEHHVEMAGIGAQKGVAAVSYEYEPLSHPSSTSPSPPAGGEVNLDPGRGGGPGERLKFDTAGGASVSRNLDSGALPVDVDSGGFRNVSLSLAIVTPLTRALGVDNHLCELQLMLRSFADIQVLASES